MRLDIGDKKIMRKKIEWEPEILAHYDDGKSCSEVTRMKVIGGWIVHYLLISKGQPSQTSQFIPDRDHEWTIVKPKPNEKPPMESVAKDFAPA